MELNQNMYFLWYKTPSQEGIMNCMLDAAWNGSIEDCIKSMSDSEKKLYTSSVRYFNYHTLKHRH